MVLARSRALRNAGNSMLARMAMIAITTRSSMSVDPRALSLSKGSMRVNANRVLSPSADGSKGSIKVNVPGLACALRASAVARPRL